MNPRLQPTPRFCGAAYLTHKSGESLADCQDAVAFASDSRAVHNPQPSRRCRLPDTSHQPCAQNGTAALPTSRNGTHTNALPINSGSRASRAATSTAGSGGSQAAAVRPPDGTRNPCEPPAGSSSARNRAGSHHAAGKPGHPGSLSLGFHFGFQQPTDAGARGATEYRTYLTQP